MAAACPAGPGLRGEHDGGLRAIAGAVPGLVRCGRAELAAGTGQFGQLTRALGLQRRITPKRARRTSMTSTDDDLSHSCGGDMSTPQKCLPTRHYLQTTSDNRRSGRQPWPLGCWPRRTERAFCDPGPTAKLLDEWRNWCGSGDPSGALLTGHRSWAAGMGSPGV
jgi:hypothetical protein